MSGDKGGWAIVGEPLGEGGQSNVYLVRRPERSSARRNDILKIFSFSPWGTYMANTREPLTGEFATAVADYARAEEPAELAAMKVFKVRDDEEQAKQRLSVEIEVLSTNTRPGLPKMLDGNLDQRWVVTEYFPRKTLEHNSSLYAGKSLAALKAFLSLVKTVAALHSEGIVHRDIKPHNVFVRTHDDLVLGDFGIVFLPDAPTRLTLTKETVGPHDYMPPWGEGGRLDEVEPKFDIYMLGKLLWCMVSGRLRLQREWFDRDEYNLVRQFPDDPSMHMVNVILKNCVVENPKQCTISASDLTAIVTTYIQMLELGGQLLHEGIPRPCHVCGHGHYESKGHPQLMPPISPGSQVGLQIWVDGKQTTLGVFPFACSTCGHVEFFTRPTPKFRSEA